MLCAADDYNYMCHTWANGFSDSQAVIDKCQIFAK